MAPVPIDEREYLEQDDQIVLFTATSTMPLARGYSSCDWVLELGAVIIDCKEERVLLFQDKDGTWSLPTHAVENGVAHAMENPLQFFEDETGYRIQRLAVRKLVKELRNTESDNMDDVDPSTLLSSETSTDAFHMTLDILWIEDNLSQIKQPRQAVKLWYAGYIADNEPGTTAPRQSTDFERVGHLVPFSEATWLLYENDKVSDLHPRVLDLLSLLWKHRDAPDGMDFDAVDEK